MVSVRCGPLEDSVRSVETLTCIFITGLSAYTLSYVYNNIYRKEAHLSYFTKTDNGNATIWAIPWQPLPRLSYSWALCYLKPPSTLQGFSYLTLISRDSWVSPVDSILWVNRAETYSLHRPKTWTFFGLNPCSFGIVKVRYLLPVSILATVWRCLGIWAGHRHLSRNEMRKATPEQGHEEKVASWEDDKEQICTGEGRVESHLLRGLAQRDCCPFWKASWRRERENHRTF